MSRPVVIGLTGGVASGKSTVAKMFKRLGAVVLDGDRLGHEILENPDVKADIRVIWGDGVFTEDGDVNRKALGNIVFGSPDRKQLSKLESITHPKIRVRILEELRLFSGQSHLAVVLDAPLLFEAGWDELCDKVIFVKTSLRDRIERSQSRGWNEKELQRRELQQLDLQHKEQNSTNTIENTTNLKATFSQVKRLWMSWGLPIADQSQP